MQSKTLQGQIGDDEEKELQGKIEAAPDPSARSTHLRQAPSLNDEEEDYGLSLQTKLKKQFKAIEELKEKKKILEDILKEAEEQNEVIQEILEEIDEKKDLLKSEREQLKGENVETVDKLRNLKKELKEESELFSDMLLVAYEKKEQVVLQDKEGRELKIEVKAKLTAQK